MVNKFSQSTGVAAYHCCAGNFATGSQRHRVVRTHIYIILDVRSSLVNRYVHGFVFIRYTAVPGNHESTAVCAATPIVRGETAGVKGTHCKPMKVFVPARPFARQHNQY